MEKKKSANTGSMDLSKWRNNGISIIEVSTGNFLKKNVTALNVFYHSTFAPPNEDHAHTI